MALPTKRNLGDLRQELAARLGYAAQGSTAGPNSLTLNSFLRTSQAFLYEEYDFVELKTEDDTTCGVDQTLYDYPTDCDPMQISAVELVDNSTSTPNIHPMRQGIYWEHDNYATPSTIPRRYDLLDQIEIWPSPDSVNYDIRLHYIERLATFTSDSDLATINEDLILTLAIGDAKAHYQHPDAPLYFDRAAQLLGSLKKKNMGTERFIRPNKSMRGTSGRASYVQHKHIDDV